MARSMESYINGFEEGARHVLDAIKSQHPDLDNPEFGGPISTGEDSLQAMMKTFAKWNRSSRLPTRESEDS